MTSIFAAAMSPWDASRAASQQLDHVNLRAGKRGPMAQ